MPNTIHIPAPLRPFTDKQESVEVNGNNVGELLADRTGQMRQGVGRDPRRMLELVGRDREEMRPHSRLGVERGKYSGLDLQEFVHPRPAFAGRGQRCAALDAATRSHHLTPFDVQS